MKRLLLFVLLGLLVFAQCKKEKKEDPDFGTKEKTYKIVWQDEFDVDGSPDPSKWGVERGFMRNKEEQYYTDNPSNVRIENGVLVLEAKKEKVVNEAFTFVNDSNWKFNRDTAEYTSASLITRDIASWKFGKIEIKAKIPKGRGMWPAIWMVGDNISSVGWPECGEIDIMEYVGYQASKIHGTVHTKVYNHVLNTQKEGVKSVVNPFDDFHVYSVEWTDKKIDIMFDGEIYLTFENENKTTAEWPFNQKFFMILNVAVGGGWGGQQGIDDSIFPQRMEVDYVRVYQLRY